MNMKQKDEEYQKKYSYIPKDLNERLNWLYDELKLTPDMRDKILEERERRLQNMYYTMIQVVLYQIPQGAKRPRFRIVGKKNLSSAAKFDSEFVHVYSPGAAENHMYMKRIVDDNEFNFLNQLICTPCDVEFRAYFPTPKNYNKIETFMAEIGLDRPLVKPDFDNIAKLYSDMYNANIWLDDALTIRGCCDKFYSVLPRVEIDLRFLNGVYNKHQYKNITNRKDFTEDMTLQYI